MIEKAIAAFITVRDAHEAIYKHILELQNEMKSTHDDKESADIAYALSEMQKLADDSEKEIRLLYDRYVIRTAVLWLNNPKNATQPQAIKTDYVTATPTVKLAPDIPSRKEKPEEFRKLMEWLKVPPALYDVPEGESIVVSPHYPGLVTFVTNALNEGRPLPKGLSLANTKRKYSLAMRSRKGVDAGKIEPDESAF